MRPKRESIAQMRLLWISICGLKVNCKSYRFVAGFDKRYVWIVILMLCKHNLVFVGLCKRQDFWKKMDFENF